MTAALRRWLRLWPLGTGPLRIREVGPHEHRYVAVTMDAGPWTFHDGLYRPPMQMIAGYRCRCGRPKPWPRHSPSDHVRAALRYWTDRHGPV